MTAVDHGGDAARPALRALAAAIALVAVAGCAREATLYTDDGVVRARGERSLWTGRPVGAWSWRFPSGELREEGEYADGRRVGPWTQRYPSGQLRARGERRWDERARCSPREGPWTFWHENGVVAAHGLFRRGRREGHWEFTNRDGSLDAAPTGEYHEGAKLDGRR